MSVPQSNGTSHGSEPSTASVLSDSATVTGSPQNSTFASTSTGIPASGLPAVIPPPDQHTGRSLIVCFDGTGDQFDADNSNIIEFFTMLKKDDPDKQMVYYQAGIGTYIKPQVATPFVAKMSKLVDEAIAWNLDAHVMDGYEFLMQNYKAGDRICIFGFSRGAYTARSLAGMIHKVGLLPTCNHQQVPFAYKMFTRSDDLGWQQSNAFKKAFSIDVPIEFIGVWDTVNSVGLIPHRLPFTTSNTIVRTFRHAISLDEHRAKFKANLWNRPNANESKLGIDGQKPFIGVTHHPTQNGLVHHPQRHPSLKIMEEKYAGQGERPTDVDEVWFSGCHCDVGGGSVENGFPYSLARISLRWMIRECFKTDAGILFTCEGLRSAGLDPSMLYPTVRTRPPPLSVSGVHLQNIPSASEKKLILEQAKTEILETEEEHELRDAMSPIYDELALAPFWWILELLPIKQHYQKGDNSWTSYLACNLGRARFIPKQKVNKIRIHRSVKMRMDAQYPNGKKYVPQASFEVATQAGNIEWVD